MVWVPPAISMPYRSARSRIERLLASSAPSRPGTNATGTASHSMAIGSSSASRSRPTVRTGSAGETWRRAPKRAPQADGGGERAARARHAATRHVLGERYDPQPLHVLGPGGVRARALPADEIAVPDQLVERPAEGHPGAAEPDTQLPLGWDRDPGGELLDDVHDRVPQDLVLGMLVGGIGRTCHRIASGQRSSTPACSRSSWSAWRRLNLDRIARGEHRVATHAAANAPAASPTPHSTGCSR